MDPLASIVGMFKGFSIGLLVGLVLGGIFGYIVGVDACRASAAKAGAGAYVVENAASQKTVWRWSDVREGETPLE